jgi:hypothetical protein
MECLKVMDAKKAKYTGQTVNRAFSELFRVKDDIY